jgi:hypothetical protein
MDSVQADHFLRTQRKPFESMVKHTSVSPASSQFRTQDVQLSALLDHAPPLNTRFSPSFGPWGLSRGLSRKYLDP